MADFEIGQRVEANLSGLLPMLGQGSFTHGTIVGIEGDTYLVKTTEFSDGATRVDTFPLTADRLSALPS
jgi:hypothetical protein